ncbi:MAG TPA: phage tail protein [Novosphingobium sp.]|nr:phage tail protein [Novosphingobium sp.]
MKVLKIAAIVVTAVVVVATAGVALAGGVSLITAFNGLMIGLGTTLGFSSTVLMGLLGVTAALDLSMIAGALINSPAPSGGGSQTKWKADPYAGIPYAMGRTLVSGNIVARLMRGGNNEFAGYVTVLSLGPILAINTTFLNKTTVVWDGTGQGGGGAATGTYSRLIWEKRTLGLCPETHAVGYDEGYSNWGEADKLSGLACVFDTFSYDSSREDTITSIPAPAWIIQGVMVYDPRLDSTYPGGSGPCRALDESTYVWSEDPHLHALTWCLGRYQNGVRVAGPGAPIGMIDVPAFVEGANLNDARGWKLGGQVYTRPDTPWNSLKAMLQAGGAAPAIIGGRVTCINRMPRAALATITHRDIVGKCTIKGTQPRRTRINGIIPQYRSEDHDWELVSGAEVSVADYVEIDGQERTKEVSYPLVQSVTQASQLAAYDICDARELGPVSIPVGPAWLNYKLGDCLYFQPEEGWSVKVKVTGRSIDASTGIVTLTAQGETDGKHAFALGQTGTAPAISSLTYDFGIAAPTTDWALTGTTLTAADGTATPALVVAGAVTNPNTESVIIEYRPYISTATDSENWISASTDTPTITRKEITSITSGAQYQASVRYRVRGVLGARAIFGPVTAGALSINGGTLQNGSVDTAQLATGSVTGSVRVLSSGSFTGNGSWQAVASMSVVLADSSEIDVYFNAEQSYSSTARGWGLRVLVNGVVVKQFPYQSRGALTDIVSIQRSGISLAAGTSTVEVDWAADDATVILRNIDVSAIRRSA